MHPRVDASALQPEVVACLEAQEGKYDKQDI